MIQQINLYQRNEAGDAKVLTNPYVLSVLAAGLLMLIAGGYGLFTLYANRAELARLQSLVQESKAHLQQVQAQYPGQQVDALLNLELQQTQKNYQNLSQLSELLSDTQSDRARGFSRYFAALAEQADSNIWLTGIQLNNETADLTLLGSTFKPEQIPLMLKRLQNTSAFKGRHFAKLSILQSPDLAEQVNFNVSSSLKSEAASDVSQH
jgi:hypothetical protein